MSGPASADSQAAARPLAGRVVTVFGSSTLGPEAPGWALAVETGRALAEAGAGVMNGGYGGAMEAVSHGARAAGGEVIGVTVSAFPERTPNRWLSARRHTATLHERLEILLSADAYVALEGSVGTVTEFFLAWNLVMLEPPPGRPLVCLGDGWRRLLPALRESGLITDQALHALVGIEQTPAAAVGRLIRALCARPRSRTPSSP